MVNGMLENSPNSETERTPPSRSLSSGTEKVGFSSRRPGALWRMYISRSSPRLTRGLSSTPRTRVKMAALAPMPRASVRITIAARASERLRQWNATRISRRKDMAQASPIRNENSIIGPIAKQHIARYLLRSASGRMLGFRMQCREFGQLRIGLQPEQQAAFTLTTTGSPRNRQGFKKSLVLLAAIFSIRAAMRGYPSASCVPPMSNIRIMQHQRRRWQRLSHGPRLAGKGCTAKRSAGIFDKERHDGTQAHSI